MFRLVFIALFITVCMTLFPDVAFCGLVKDIVEGTGDVVEAIWKGVIGALFSIIFVPIVIFIGLILSVWAIIKALGLLFSTLFGGGGSGYQTRYRR